MRQLLAPASFSFWLLFSENLGTRPRSRLGTEHRPVYFARGDVPGFIVSWGTQVVAEQSALEDLTAVAGGGYHNLGLKSDGTVVAWGFNQFGQCDVPAPNAGFVAVAGGCDHSLGLKSDRTIVAWGWNGYGQSDAPSPNADFVGVAGGGYHSLGLRFNAQSALFDPAPGRPSDRDMPRIHSVAPNPPVHWTEIAFTVQEPGLVSMDVHDITGRHVATTAFGALGPGRHRVTWAARDAARGRLTSGVYLLRLRRGERESEAVRVLLVQ